MYNSEDEWIPLGKEGWLSLDDEDNAITRYREYYHKNPRVSFEYRANRVSDYLDFSKASIPCPIGFEGKTIVALNHPHRITSLIREKESGVEYISEGLIATYPIDKIIDRYREFYKALLPKEFQELTVGDVYRKASELNATRTKIRDYVFNSKNNPPIVCFMFPYYRSKNDEHQKEFVKKLVDDLFVCGYGLSSCFKISPPSEIYQKFKDEIDLWQIQFEAKFFEPKPDLSDVLYHVAPSRYFEKIKRQGLIPRSKSDRFKYPERVYLFNKASIEDITKYGFTKVSLLKQFHGTPYVNDNGFYLFSIKKSNLENYAPYKERKTIFYFDPCYDGGMGGISTSKAIFTYNNIPRNLLEHTCYYYETSSPIASKSTKVSMDMS